MKIRYTLILFSLISIAARAQQPTVLFNLNFEDTAVINQFFYTDSLLDPAAVWQIGKPHKYFFDSAYSPPNALVTRLDSALLPGTKASFIITLPSVLYYPFGAQFLFTNRYDFDSGHGGAYVEFSVDTGRHWHGVYTTGAHETHPFGADCIYEYAPVYIDGQSIFPPTWWGDVQGDIPMDTTADGIAYFTGTDSVWRQAKIVIPTFVPVKTSLQTTYMFRFTAFSDSLSRPTSGWMIDDMNFQEHFFYCPGGISEINSAHLKVYPDPATDAFHISMTDLHTSDYEVTICDLSGRVVMRESFQGQELQMHRGDTDAGSYLIQVRDRHTGDSFQKRIVFE